VSTAEHRARLVRARARRVCIRSRKLGVRVPGVPVGLFVRKKILAEARRHPTKY
jgi:hypothetical protein